MNKNTKVATAKEGKTPTGKVKDLAARNARRAAAEQEYINFRVNALKRRCKRMGTSEEETKKLIEQLMIDIKAPKKYSIHVLFRSGQKYEVDKEGKKHGTAFSTLATEAIKNSKIEYKILTPAWALIEGGKEVLDKLREILAGWATIHPYEIKPKPPKSEPVKVKKPSNNSKTAAAAGKVNGRRKRANVAAMSKNQRKAFMLQVEALKASWKASKKSTSKVVNMKKTKRSTGSKKASTELKKAA